MKNFKLVAAQSNPYLRAGVENLFTITGRMNCGILLAGSKINYFILKFYLYPTMSKSDFFCLTM